MIKTSIKLIILTIVTTLGFTLLFLPINYGDLFFSFIKSGNMGLPLLLSILGRGFFIFFSPRFGLYGNKRSDPWGDFGRSFFPTPKSSREVVVERKEIREKQSLKEMQEDKGENLPDYINLTNPEMKVCLNPPKEILEEVPSAQTQKLGENFSKRLEHEKTFGPINKEKRTVLVDILAEKNKNDEMECKAIVEAREKFFMDCYQTCLDFFQIWPGHQWVISLVSLVGLYWVTGYFYNRGLSASGGWLSGKMRIGLILSDLMINFTLGLYYMHHRDTTMGLIMVKCPIAISPIIFIGELVCVYIYYKYISKSENFSKLCEHKKRFMQWLWGLFPKFRSSLKKFGNNFLKECRLGFAYLKVGIKAKYEEFKNTRFQ